MFGWYWVVGFGGLTVALWLYVQFLRWVWAPVRVKRRSFSAIVPQWLAVTDADLTPEQRDVLARLTDGFARAGFARPVLRRNAGSISGADGIQLLMAHADTGDLATVIVARASRTRTIVFAITSAFADGSRVATGVNRGIGVFPKPPADDTANFAWVRDVPTLVEAHGRRLDRVGRRGTVREPFDADRVDDYLCRQWDREHAWWVRCGYRYRDDAAGRYRPTWQGAFLSTWKVTQPVKGWRVRRRNRRAERQWRELGMDTWRPPAGEAAATLPVDPGPVVAPVAEPSLGYESVLAEGEVRHERLADGVTVRCGAPTAGRLLLRQWGPLLSAVLFVSLLSFTAARVVMAWQFYAFLPPAMRWAVTRDVAYHLRGYLLLWTGLVAWDVVRIVRAVRQARGTITVTASPAGLRCENLPGRRRDGHLDRDELSGLVVVLDRIGLSGKRYRLDARRADPGESRLTLMRSPTAAPLDAARNALLAAMGMVAESADVPEA